MWYPGIPMTIVSFRRFADEQAAQCDKLRRILHRDERIDFTPFSSGTCSKVLEEMSAQQQQELFRAIPFRQRMILLNKIEGWSTIQNLVAMCDKDDEIFEHAVVGTVFFSHLLNQRKIPKKIAENLIKRSVEQNDVWLLCEIIERVPKYANEISPDISYGLLKIAKDRRILQSFLQLLNFGTDKKRVEEIFKIYKKSIDFGYFHCPFLTESHIFNIFSCSVLIRGPQGLKRFLNIWDIRCIPAHVIAHVLSFWFLSACQCTHILADTPGADLSKISTRSQMYLMDRRFLVRAHVRGWLSSISAHDKKIGAWDALNFENLQTHVLVNLAKEQNGRLCRERATKLIRDRATPIFDCVQSGKYFRRLACLFQRDGVDIESILKSHTNIFASYGRSAAQEEKERATLRIQKWWLQICYDPSRDIHRRIAKKLSECAHDTKCSL